MSDLRVVIAAVVVLGVMALATMWAGAAKCAYCPAVPCYVAGACAPGCVCVFPPGQVQGECWGVD